jgi:hypothetical protein
MRAAVIRLEHGPVERQIDRPKTTEFQTYGRAGIALLGRGFLLAA